MIKRWLQKWLVEDYLVDHYIGRAINGIANDAVRYHLREQGEQFNEILINKILEKVEQVIKSNNKNGRTKK